MNLFDFPPLAFLLDVTFSALVALSDLLSPATGSAASAVAIVLVTLVVRAALIPVGVAQARAEQGRARLSPRLAELQKKHRSDRERLQRETMKLYRDEDVSPFAGCLPVLAQAPIVGLLYGVFLHPVIAGHANTLLTDTLWGVPLGATLLGTVTSGAVDGTALLVFGGVILAIAAVAELTRRAFRPGAAASTPAFAAAMLGAAPFVTAVVAAFVPLAAGLYLLVTVTWTLGQRLVLRRLLPLP